MQSCRELKLVQPRPALLVKYPKLFIMVSLCIIGEDYTLNFKDYNDGTYI